MLDERDSELTAYALGELDEQGRAAIEARMAASPELRSEVEGIRRTAAALREALASDPSHALSPAQRAALVSEAARQPLTRPRRAPFRWVIWAGISVAAAGLLVAIVTPSLMRARLAPVAPVVRQPPASVTPSTSIAQPPATTLTAPSRPEPRWASDVPATAAPPPAPPPAEWRAAPAPQSAEERDKLRALGYVGRVEGGVAGGVVGGVVGGVATIPPPARLDKGELAGAERQSADARRAPSAPFDTEAYDSIRDNPFVRVADDPRSTFSVDVDTASYSNVRRFLNEGRRPPKDAVRIEELINYFRYTDAPPRDGRPFAVHLDAASCPWAPEHRLVRIAIKGREIPRGERPPANLVFLLDVSGSMRAPNKLPLVQQAMKLLVGELGPRDRVAIVVYAGSEGLVLPSTPATDRETILSAIDRLTAGGSTHASAGIRLAYETAAAGFVRGGVNRVILATDGDFNVGVTNQGDLVRLIEEKAKSGVFLTALGFGMGNYKDSTLEKLADRGNGNYAYIDGLHEARKTLVEEVGSTLVTIAKDVKLQLEFNPASVQAFRLIGYENRVLAHQDFNDDARDAGEIGAGHSVTALYEIVPQGAPFAGPSVDPLRYQQPARPAAGGAASSELLTLKLRYKEPEGTQSSRIEVPLQDSGRRFEDASADFRFAAAVAAFGMALRESPHRGGADLDQALAWAKASLGEDPGSLRAELLTLVEKARALR